MKEKNKNLIPALVIFTVVLICIVWIAVQQLTKQKGLSAEVRVSGKTVITITLSSPSRNVINGANGIELVAVVSDGCVFVEHSDCPDKICEKMGKKASVGDTIICLPAQTVIEVIEKPV